MTIQSCIFLHPLPSILTVNALVPVQFFLAETSRPFLLSLIILPIPSKLLHYILFNLNFLFKSFHWSPLPQGKGPGSRAWLTGLHSLAHHAKLQLPLLLPAHSLLGPGNLACPLQLSLDISITETSQPDPPHWVKFNSTLCSPQMDTFFMLLWSLIHTVSAPHPHIPPHSYPHLHTCTQSSLRADAPNTAHVVLSTGSTGGGDEQ